MSDQTPQNLPEAQVRAALTAEVNEALDLLSAEERNVYIQMYGNMAHNVVHPVVYAAAEELRSILDEVEPPPPTYADLSTFTREEWLEFRRSGGRTDFVGEDVIAERVFECTGALLTAFPFRRLRAAARVFEMTRSAITLYRARGLIYKNL